MNVRSCTGNVTIRLTLVSFFVLSIVTANTTLAQDDNESVAVSFVDSAGAPLSGVEAYWFRDTKAKKLTVTNGKTAVGARRGLVVAQLDGHPYAGVVLDGLESKDAVVVIRRHDEPGPLRTTRPMPIDDATKRQIFDQIETLYWGKVNDTPNDPTTVANSLSLLAHLSPKKVAGYLAMNPLTEPYEMMVKQALVQSFLRDDFELAAEVVNSVDKPMGRASLLFALLKNLPATSPHREAIEVQFADTIRSIPQAQYRFAVWASLAEHYVATDRPSLAQAIVDDMLDDVKKLPSGGWSGYPRSLFAALIVEKDPALARELVSGMDANEKNRAVARIAFACCRSNPELAIKLLGDIEYPPNTINVSNYEMRIIDRFASAQPDAALKLAAEIEEPNQRAWAYGMIASELKDLDPVKTRIAINQAIEILKPVNAKETLGSYSRQTTLAGLLPIVETVAPEQVDSVIWQSVWLSVPKSRWSTTGHSKRSNLQNTAAAIMRYDDAIARAMIGDAEIELGMDPVRAILNQLAFDPRLIADMLNDYETKRYSFGFRPRKRVIEVLNAGRDGKTFWNAISLPSFFKSPGGPFEDD